MRKEIYAALQVSGHEIRILVGENHNNRLHILKVERVAHTGMENNEIVNPESIIEAIKKAILNIEKNVKIKVSRVLLVIPSIMLERIKRSIHSDVNDPLNRILRENIIQIYQSAYNQKPVENRELINALIYQYKVNGVQLRKPPINEKSSRLFAEVDLYYVNRKTVYQLASIVEQANLQILDVCVDQIGIAKEASLFDYDNENYIVVIDVERQATTLGLVYKGHLIHGDILNIQFGEWINHISDSFSIPYDVSAKLMLNNVDLDNPNPGKEPICLWSRDKKSYTCSQQDIMELIQTDIDESIQTIKEACLEIMEAGPTEFVVVGEGSMIKGIESRLKKELDRPVRAYLPNTLGARDGALVALLGAFYNHIDMKQWQKNTVDPQVMQQATPPQPRTPKVDSKITDKLKKILSQTMDEGDLDE